MDSHLFSSWMNKFIEILQNRKFFRPTKKHMIVLDGHEFYVTLEVIIKARQHNNNLIILLSHTNHELQSLDVAYFRPFKKYIRIFRIV